MKVQTYTIKGVKTEEEILPKDFDVQVNMSLLAQAVYVYENRAHIGLRKTKTRSEINRTTKKVYKQKGTGGARHGSRRAPIFVGGGIALGPRPVKRVLSLSAALKERAKFMAFRLKAEEKGMIFVSGISKIGKTKEAAALLKALQKETGTKRFTFVLSQRAQEAVKFLKNLKNASHVFYKDANAYDIYKGGVIVMDKEIFAKQTAEAPKVAQASKAKAETTKKTVKKSTKAAKTDK